MAKNSSGLPLKQITLGGEIADQYTLDSLKTAFPQARITHIYASTEAGVGFSVTDKLEGFPVAFLQQPPQNIELKVIGDRLFVRNTLVNASYVGGERFVDVEGYIDTGDVVERLGDRFRFLGRANGAINIGGNKVHPEKIENVFLQHPKVSQARVTARRNPITGALVHADVVLRSGCEANIPQLRRELMHFCRCRLTRHEIPATIRIVDQLETNAVGKLVRHVD